MTNLTVAQSLLTYPNMIEKYDIDSKFFKMVAVAQHAVYFRYHIIGYQYAQGPVWYNLKVKLKKYLTDNSIN